MTWGGRREPSKKNKTWHDSSVDKRGVKNSVLCVSSSTRPKEGETWETLKVLDHDSTFTCHTSFSFLVWGAKLLKLFLVWTKFLKFGTRRILVSLDSRCGHAVFHGNLRGPSPQKCHVSHQWPTSSRDNDGKRSLRFP